MDIDEATVRGVVETLQACESALDPLGGRSLALRERIATFHVELLAKLPKADPDAVDA